MIRTLAIVGIGATTLGVHGQVELNLTQAERDWLAAHPRITLGPYRNYPPIQFVDDQGVHRGIAAEYVDRIEKMLGITFASVATETWRELLDKARAREIDVIALAAKTAERSEYLSFTRAYLDLPVELIARDDVDRELSLRDLEGLRVSVTSGYAVEDFLRERYPGLLLDPVPDTRTGLRKVSFGMSDVFASDLAVASHFIEQEGITNLHVVGETGFVYRMGFASRNDWPQLGRILEKALEAIPPAERHAIRERWISLDHDHEVASTMLRNVLIGTMLAVAGVAVGVLIWNASLQRRVTRRTKALEESEQRTRLIINTALDAVITMDARGITTGWSAQAQETFGWSLEEALGHPLAELIIPPRYRDAHQKGLTDYLETGEGPVLNTRIEITGMHKDGHEIPVELAISPMQRSGAVEFSAFVRDISQRKKNEAELERHRHRLEELVAERTAEIRKLRDLLPICSYCKRIREGEEYTKSVEAYLAEHHDTQFSHGVCPECYEKHVRPQLEKL